MKKIIFILLFSFISFISIAQYKVRAEGVFPVAWMGYATTFPTFKEIPLDKKKHFFYSAGLTLISSGVYRVFSKDKNKIHCLLFGVGSSLLVSTIGKELIHDEILGKGVLNKEDIFANLLGTGFGSFLIIYNF